MHEQHLAAGLLAQALQQTGGKPIQKIRLENPPFSGIATASLELYMGMALDELGMEGVQVEIAEPDGRFRCVCGQVFETRRFSDPCPSCRGEERVLLFGKECRLIGVVTG